MSKREKIKRMKQIKNYLTFVASGVILIIIVALVSGCGSRSLEEDNDDGHRKVLSQAEIQKLTDLVVTDATVENLEDSLYEDEDETLGIVAKDVDSNSHYTYVWGWEGEDDEDDEAPQLLAQLSEDGQIQQTFSEDKIALYPDRKKDVLIELRGATDHELVFCADPYLTDGDPNIWYRIPLSYENGQEKLLCDRKEVIYEEKSWMGKLSYGAENYLFFEDGKGCFVLDQESKKKQRVVKGSKQLSYRYNETEPWVSPQGDIYVLLNGYRDGLVDSFYAYQLGKEGVQEITGGVYSESRTAFGDGKLFFTRLADDQGHDDYNIYVYDMISGQKKVLVSEAEIRDILPEQPSEHADFLREIAYAQGNLYLEIRYAGKSYVLSCDVDEGTPVILGGLSELVKHREYQLPEAIKDGNRNYYNVNDHNIFEVSEDGVVERTLDGAYVRTIRRPYTFLYATCTFLYANNRELIYAFTEDECEGSKLYSVPLVSLDGNDYPDIHHMEKILDKVGYADNVWPGNLYADEEYLVYITAGHSFTVYDRQAGKFLKLDRMQKERDGFRSGDIMSSLSGENVFFSSETLLLYHFGDKKVTPVDPRHFAYRSVWSEDGKRIIYERYRDDKYEAMEVCSYDISAGSDTSNGGNTSERGVKVLFTEEDLQLASQKQASEKQDAKNYYPERGFLADGKMYYIVEADKSNEYLIFSYDLTGEGKLEYEAQISDFINVDVDLALGPVGVAEGKLFIQKYQKDEEGAQIKNTTKSYYYDLSSGKHAGFGKDDKEGLYLSLVDMDW